MREEIEHVLARGRLGSRWPNGAASVRDGWQRWATLVDEAPAPAALAMRCNDPDDQKFIDLALARRAIALLSADRAVLRLARRAIPFGLAITVVSAWRLAPARAATATRGEARPTGAPTARGDPS
jgi:predicted nucleic acid-binding protein